MRRAPAGIGVALALASMGLVGEGCVGLTAEQPLTATQPLPDPSGSSTTGATGAGGETTTGAAGSGPLAGGGDGRVAVEPTCWAGQLPPEVQPILPTMTVANACALSPASTQGSYPGSAMSSNDDRARIVGRWASCGAGGVFSPSEHAGIEFGANGRWRLLATDGNGLAPEAPSAGGATGAYYLLSSGQLEVVGEGVNGTRHTFFVSFTPGMDVMRLDAGSALATSTSTYARAQPGPLNGDDNPPSISDGRCSMVGTWAVPANTQTPTAPALTMSFDAAGNFVAGPKGSDLCVAHTAYGTYSLSADGFELVTNIGLGLCSWWFNAAYLTTFDDGCAHVTLVRLWDNCTGGRGTFNETSTLTRLQ